MSDCEDAVSEKHEFKAHPLNKAMCYFCYTSGHGQVRESDPIHEQPSAPERYRPHRYIEDLDGLCVICVNHEDYPLHKSSTPESDHEMAVRDVAKASNLYTELRYSLFVPKRDAIEAVQKCLKSPDTFTDFVVSYAVAQRERVIALERELAQAVAAAQGVTHLYCKAMVQVLTVDQINALTAKVLELELKELKNERR